MHSFSTFPVPPGRFWGKLHPRANPIEWHPLIAHSADVAAAVERVLLPGTPVAHRLAALLGQEELTPAQRARMVFLAVLHDMGKCNHGFQTKARPPAERGDWKPTQRGHVTLLLESMGVSPLQRLVGREVLPVLGRDLNAAADLFTGAISHHGRPCNPGTAPNREALWRPDGSGRDPLAEIRRLVVHARRWSGVDETAGEALVPVPPAFTHLFAGVLMLADWIGSTRSAFEFAPEADDDPDGYWAVARRRAAEACARIGVVPRTRPVAADVVGHRLLERVFPAVFRPGGPPPTDLQRYAATMDLPPPGARLLIESETGSGKTEAALALYARLRAAGRVGGLMFALPTRATASAMLERVDMALDGMYEEGARPTLALAVGGQQPRLQSEEPWVREAPQLWGDARARRELESWASSHSKKFLAAEIVVGTLDQVLLGGLPVNHAHLRLAALSRHLLVVDELHSFDRYMTAVLANVLDLHSRAGGLALFMSATLSAATRRAFAGGPELREEEAVALPYPTLAVCSAAGEGWRDHCLEATSRAKHVHWQAVDESEALRDAVVSARAGARVLLLCNTVRRARNAVEALTEAGHGHLLWQPTDSSHTPPYHSRYTLPDRLALDAAVRDRFGKEAADRAGGVILVSTQVAEQSLDVDFDLLVTDLCPVDVLLQRIGRLHRHAERDPYRPQDYREPRVRVIAPEGGFATRLRQKAIELGWGEDRPYRNYADGALTLRAIARGPRIEIPRENRRLVEAVYHEDSRGGLRGETGWEDYLCVAEGRELTHAWMGNETSLRFEETYTACARSFNLAREQKIRTRIGDETIRFPLPCEVPCWYARPIEPVQSVDLPVWALPRDEGPQATYPPLATIRVEGRAEFSLGSRRLRYLPHGWVWD